jgi:sugar phosphate permease
MSDAAPSAQKAQNPKLPFNLTRVAVLLSVSVLINYVDRGTLSIAAPILKDDLHLSPSQLGVLLSSLSKSSPGGWWIASRSIGFWPLAFWCGPPPR